MTMLYRLFPFLRWVNELRDPNVVRCDLIAGITVAMLLVPQSMAYAQLAGLPAYYGLYAAFVPVIIGALWGSSRYLKTGPVAMVSIMTAAAIAPFAQQGSEQFVVLAIVLALLVGVIQLLMGLCRMGHVVNFLSNPVVLGFTNAAALIIGLSQLNEIFGVNKPRSDIFLLDIAGVFAQIPDTHLLSVVMAAIALSLLWASKRYAPKAPGVLIAVSVTTLVSWLLNFEASGGKVVGAIPDGLPSLSVPQLDWSIISALLLPALMIAIIGYAEAISIAKAMAAKTKTRIDTNQELVGQGLANIFGSFAQAYPSSGSFSRSAVNLEAGARTGFSSVVAAITVLLTLLLFTPLLYHMPKAVLAIVIMLAVAGLVNFRAMWRAWSVHKHDGLAALVTFVATLAFAPHLEKGLMIGAGLAIALHLYRTMRPRAVLLSHYQHDVPHVAELENVTEDSRSIVVFRFDDALYFANVAHFEDTLLRAAANYKGIKYILVISDGINHVDASGENMLRHTIEELKSAGVTLVFSGLRPQVIRVMKKTGLYSLIGQQNIFSSAGVALQMVAQRVDAVSEQSDLGSSGNKIVSA